MSKIKYSKEMVVISIIIVLTCIYFYYMYMRDNNIENLRLNNKIRNIENKMQNINANNIADKYNDPVFRTPRQTNSLDRVFNPLRYPYKSDNYYSQSWRPNLALPPQVVGCGGRNLPCLGGTQVPIANPMVPLDYSNTNIAPVNIRTRGPLGQPQRVGALYRLYSRNNEVLPLYGRKKYPNGSNNWEYYTVVGNHDVKLPLLTKRRGYELGTNDVVFIRGYNRSPYRVTVYESDFPQYIPYL